MTGTTQILVGVDGSAHSRAAIGWAVQEAALRGSTVLLVHVSDAAAYGLWTTTRTIRQGLRELAQPIVDHAVDYAHSVNPAVPVRGRLILGSPVRTLLTLSTASTLIVVGRQGKGALAAHLVGSVSRYLMAHAHCPVIAVQPPAAGEHSMPVKRVVVAVGDRQTTLRALEFGSQEAHLRGVPLRVLHACHQPGWPYLTGQAGTVLPADEIEAERARIADLLTTAPVDTTGIEPVVHLGTPAQVMREYCRPTDLVVLGQHRHGHYLPATLGPIVSAALHELACPIAVVAEPLLAPDASSEALVATDQAERPVPAQVGVLSY
ncbi:universal stress protein [soil metagenome]